MGRCLHQGDPMSHFLFLIVAEGLNGLLRKAVDIGRFKGFSFGGDKDLSISMVQFADVTLFIGEASRQINGGLERWNLDLGVWLEKESERPRTTEPSSSSSVPVPIPVPVPVPPSPRSKNELLKEQLNQDAEDLKVKRNELVILHGLQLLNSNNNESKKDLVFEDEYEKRLLDNVITPSDIGVSFNDIGALEDVKDTLKKLVMLPIQRPELYTKGKLTKPCRGILLFGPPGTGKTMLAKAIATDAGANFINISLSSITSKFNGEEEKFVKAMFSVARKISPTVIFVDEMCAAVDLFCCGSVVVTFDAVNSVPACVVRRS
ncbi:uncharacterized protein LOC130712939 [Lotus japonicus]|uniref:uncharacterized protein LOC130712939 n=1 Tax=Lotus japonicus TaxID=34305 RepID=UPI0025839B35|nr:uncharacterized protein LOC130712939 [Lotus japonicus]